MRAIWLAVFSLGAGCSLNVDYTGTLYQCGPHDECPDGYICVENYCVPNEPPIGGTCSTQVAAGFEHTCHLRADATVWCWGRNDYGQLADNSAIDRDEPVQVANLTNITQISAGTLHTCARKMDGSVSCWG